MVHYMPFSPRSVAQSGSAFGSGPKGRGFKSLRSDQLTRRFGEFFCFKGDMDNREESGRTAFGVGRVTRFYVPLLLQAFSQSLSYPLVGGITTHGPLGVHGLTAFAQGMTVMFMIGAIGGGLVMTGMVHARTGSGYRAFRRLNFLMMGLLLLLQCVPAIPPLDTIVFQQAFRLPPELASIARDMLLGGLVMNASFFLRNVPMVVLFNNLESGKANMATLLRIALTFLLALILPALGLVGPWWGLFALTAGCIFEYFLTWWYARPYVRALLEERQIPWHSDLDDLMAAKRRYLMVLEQLRFTLPLSLGSFILAASPLAIALFVGRSADAQTMLAIHYVTVGVANPIGFGALRMQAVSIAFPPAYPGDRRMLAYAVGAGAVLGAVLLAFCIPALANWYFRVCQNVQPEHLHMARAAVAMYAVWPIFQAVRARAEGIAAVRKRPSAVMAGQITYLVALSATLAAALVLGVAGWKMSVIAVNVATLATIAAVYLALHFQRMRH